tara:strand:+ start:672 stop:914 length:243 start_codon:yes stop_codon:yes gene_type:complete
MTFEYNKKNAQCSWCKRTANPHPDYINETIPTKIFTSSSGRQIELCFSCFEVEKKRSYEQGINFTKNLDLKFETLKILNL